MNKSGSLFLKLVVCGIIFLYFMNVVAAQNEMVTMDFYYSSNNKRFNAVLYSILSEEFRKKYKEN